MHSIGQTKIAMMQQRSTDEGSAVDSRRPLTLQNVSQSVSVSSLETVSLTINC